MMKRHNGKPLPFFSLKILFCNLLFCVVMIDIFIDYFCEKQVVRTKDTLDIASLNGFRF